MPALREPFGSAARPVQSLSVESLMAKGKPDTAAHVFGPAWTAYAEHFAKCPTNPCERCKVLLAAADAERLKGRGRTEGKR